MAKSSSKSKGSSSVVHNHYTNVDLLKGKELQEYVAYLSSPRRIFFVNFLSGTAKGLGFVVGTVLVLALVTFIVSRVLVEIPWMGELFRSVDVWLQNNLDTY